MTIKNSKIHAMQLFCSASLPNTLTWVLQYSRIFRINDHHPRTTTKALLRFLRKVVLHTFPRNNRPFSRMTHPHDDDIILSGGEIGLVENKQARCSPRLLRIAMGRHIFMSIDYVRVIREKGLYRWDPHSRSFLVTSSNHTSRRTER